MRAHFGFVALAVFYGCGESGATPLFEPSSEIVLASGGALPEESPDASSPDAAPPADPPARRVESVGHLAGVDHLERLFEALANLDRGPPRDDVVIVQYGDSHTASDVGVGAFRRTLQDHFGDGGRGFVPIGRPWKTFFAQGVHAGMNAGFEPSRIVLRSSASKGSSPCSGLLGVGIESHGGGARAWSDVTVPLSHFEISYEAQPWGGSFDVLADGTKLGRVSTRATERSVGYAAFDVADAPHRIEIRTMGNGGVIAYGSNLARPSAGVVVTTLGINGAQIFTPLHWEEACFAEQLQHISPDLVVLAYGTNEALDASLTDAPYEQALTDLLGRIARAQPSASCLLLGPPDLARRAHGQDEWKTWPRVLEIIDAQKRVARAAGCAFYDQMQAMGGPGTIAQWASEAEPRAARDRVHLKQAGYELVGTSFASDLIHAYDEWRSQKGLPPAKAPPSSP